MRQLIESDHVRFAKVIQARIIELQNDLNYMRKFQPWRESKINATSKRLNENKQWLLLLELPNATYH